VKDTDEPVASSDLGMSTRAHLVRFVVVGVGTMLLDFCTYRTLLALGVIVSPAKAAGFVVGTTASYLLNRSWTFRSTVGHSAVVGFLALYGVTLLVNVGVNRLLLATFGDWTYRIEAAFLGAQAVTSALNFLGMRYLVFARR
jgi:putative flippase GtrA